MTPPRTTAVPISTVRASRRTSASPGSIHRV
jgi:hypothetical protein